MITEPKRQTSNPPSGRTGFRRPGLGSVVILGIALLVSLFIGPAAAQDRSKAQLQSERNRRATLQTLNQVRTSLADIESALQAKRYELNAADPAAKERLKKEIESLHRSLESLEKNFEEIATGIDLEPFAADRPNSKFNWSEELQDLVEPIINELRNLTERPRELERLRREIGYYEKRLPVIDQALSSAKALRGDADDDRLIKRLDRLIEDWTNKRQRAASELSVAEHQLHERLSEKRPLLESVQNLFLMFFKSRGRNLVMALLSLVLVLVASRVVYRLLVKVSPFHKNGLTHNIYIRAAEVAYTFFSVVAAFGFFLIVLYLYGDWVLLGLAMIFLVGLAWAARQTVPKFYNQIQLTLNLGAVRTGERVMINGLPWRIDSIHFYSHLTNPDLTGGWLRLPLGDLMDLRSRPFAKDESWFPTKEGDWVLLNGDELVRVISQTPDFVELLELGGARRMIPSAAFLTLNPVNLSTDFRIRSVFGIDYAHQVEAVAEAPQKLSQVIEDGLKELAGPDNLKNLAVEFKAAGASSLDLEIMADFDGRAASKYYRLSRAVQRLAVEACNQYGYVIPFTQVTIHTSSPPDREA